MDEQTETPERTPHEFFPCDGAHLFSRAAHCAVCELPPEHEIHKIAELELRGRLPVTFMLLQPQSWSPEVWSDITRMLTLNGAQSAKGKEMHLCPMQFDVADRVIAQMSNPGDVVYDPFAGIGTVPYRAVLYGRYGLGAELSIPYFLDSVAYCKAAEQKMAMPSLFDLAGVKGENGTEVPA